MKFKKGIKGVMGVMKAQCCGGIREGTLTQARRYQRK